VRKHRILTEIYKYNILIEYKVKSIIYLNKQNLF